MRVAGSWLSFALCIPDSGIDATLSSLKLSKHLSFVFYSLIGCGSEIEGKDSAP